MTDQIRSIVRLEVDKSRPDPFMPWVRNTKQELHSALVVAPNQILTCAHCIEFAKSITVFKLDSNTPFHASIVHLSRDSDLAMLKVEHVDFMNGIRPIPHTRTGERIPKYTPIFTVGYPSPSGRLHVNQGSVTTTTTTFSLTSPLNLVVVNTTACGVSGVSGGPVLNSKGVIIGISYIPSEEKRDCLSIARFLPFNTIVRQFARDLRINRRVKGVPFCGFSQALNANWNVGVYVNQVDPWSPAASKIYHRDIIWRINNRLISSRGIVQNTASLPGRPGKTLDEMVSEMMVGSLVTLDVYRRKDDQMEQLRVSYLLPECRAQYLCPIEDDASRLYFIFDKYCLTILSYAHFVQEKLKGMPCSRLARMATEVKTKSMTQQMVVMTELNADVTITGYEERTRRVFSVNNQPVHDFLELVYLIRAADGPNISFTVKNDGLDEKNIILDLVSAKERTKITIGDFDLPPDCPVL